MEDEIFLFKGLNLPMENLESHQKFLLFSLKLCIKTQFLKQFWGIFCNYHGFYPVRGYYPLKKYCEILNTNISPTYIDKLAIGRCTMNFLML